MASLLQLKITGDYLLAVGLGCIVWGSGWLGYMESTMFGCTTSLFNETNGRYMVDGTTIFLSPSRDVWKNMYSCFPNSNRSETKAPTKKSLEFSFKTDEYGKEFICLNDAAVETCYRREKE
jgi:hypothetical protein